MKLSRRRAIGLLAAMPWSITSAGAAALPEVTVHRDPSCGCCGAWGEHLRRAGFPVRIVETGNLSSIKQRLGVPADLMSCHTAEVAGFVIEGHVHAAAVRRLLSERPQAVGLAVGGMPAGSPGMEGGSPETYEVILFGPDGRRVFARYTGDREL